MNQDLWGESRQNSSYNAIYGCRWVGKESGVLEATSCVGGGKARVSETTPYFGEARPGVPASWP